VSVTYPRGFRASGVVAGLKPSGKRDFALLIGDPGTTAAGLFTTNAFAAAPVVLSRERLGGGAARAVLVNSGQANAATGPRGAADAESISASAATAAGIGPHELLACSTGVIGEPLHFDEMLDALPSVVAELSTDGGEAFAQAIMTTDTVEKQATADAEGFSVGGCAKGVGMISPNLATMLAFVTTDARVAAADLDLLAREQLGPRFEAITVDGCPSTNDTVLLFASGAAVGDPVTPGTPAWEELSSAIGDVGASLADQLIRDGEGASHVLVIDAVGAASERDARAVADLVANSPLVKTAAFGQDPNPGRIVQAVGSADVTMDPSLLDVWIGDVLVVQAGTIPPEYFEGDLREQAQLAMKEPEVLMTISLGNGPGSSRVLGCDLSYDYIRINGEYTT